MHPKTTPTNKATCAREWGRLEELKRLMRGKGPIKAAEPVTFRRTKSTVALLDAAPDPASMTTPATAVRAT